jgi:hypothetical protein
MKPLLLTLLFMFVSGIGSWSCQAQLKDRQEDFSIPVQWGSGSLMRQWGIDPLDIRKRGEEKMAEKGGKHFGQINAGNWQPTPDEQNPYLRSIVSRIMWPVGTVTEKDVGKTVTFTGLFGWYGGQLDRVKDLYLAKESGFFLGDIPVQGLKGMQDFEFGSIREKDWQELNVSYRVRREDVGKDLQLMLQVQTRQQLSGYPVLTASDWKMKVAP